MYHTPYYLIDKDALEAVVTETNDALRSYWSNYILGYSYKTNSFPWIIEYFKRKGFYAEVVSDDEYSLAQYIKVDSTKMIYNGPIKSKETMLQAIQNGCIVNLDAKREIEWLGDLNNGTSYSVGIRVNFDIEKMCPGESACGDQGGRFGFCYENGELKKAIEEIRQKNFRVAGLHLHTSSKSRSINVYRAIARVACEITQKYELELDYVDIGGGFFGGLENRPTIRDYLKEIVPILSEQFSPEKTTLIIEPGMSMIGPNIEYVTSVIDVKDTTYGRFVVTDGSRTQIDPLMSKTSYFYEIEKANQNDAVLETQVICGYTCMEHDRLFTLKNYPSLREGDIIRYQKVGAYTMCLTPLFIKYFPDVYVKNNDQINLVRSRWNAELYSQGMKESME